MARMRLDRIAEIVGGTILQGPADRVFGTFNIDTRLTVAGELFFAIIARRNGHDFVPAAAKCGATGAVVSEPVAVAKKSFNLLRVENTSAALRTLAKEVLAEHPVKVVGITGSVGKTTTKEFTAALLSQKYRILKSEGNYNNRLGLPLSILKLEPDHEVAVLEMAMSAAGEIRALAEIAPPDIAVVTNIQPVHLEFLGTIENIAAAKKEILDGLKRDGTAVLNGDDPLVAKISQGFHGRKVLFGYDERCEVRADRVQRLSGEGFELDLTYGRDRHRLRLPFHSESLIDDLLAALGSAYALGLPLAGLENTIQTLSPFDRRGTLIRLARDIVLIDDSYNSNPRALSRALLSFSKLPARRRIAVLGDMLELGDSAPSFHAKAGEETFHTGWDILVTIGPLGRHMADGAQSAGMSPDSVFSFAASEEAAQFVLSLLRQGDLVLVKGSRGIQTEKVVEKIKDAEKET
jgi:UDP-N-acetylmuramoyl-tripeptide--D-alanyl-D-alanine ligase